MISEKKNRGISMAELERRWAAIRARMAEAGLDVLVAQTNNDHMGGSVKYLTDMPAVNGYPLTVIFPRDDDMTVIRQGPVDGVTELSHQGNGIWRGVRQLLTDPFFVTGHRNSEMDGRLALRALAPYGRGRIGLVGPGQMSAAMADHLRDGLPDATFSDATAIVDQVRAVRSEEEIEMARASAALQDAAMEAALAHARPGLRERDVTAVAQDICHRHGSEQGIYLCASGAPGTPLRMNPLHLQNRVMEEGDQLVLLGETNGPGGVYTEIGRTKFLGPVPEAAERDFAFTLEARAFLLERLVPGASPAEVFAAYNAFMIARGRPPDTRLLAHSQGYDMVERPLIRGEETLRIEAGMNLAVHPTYVYEGRHSWICDNYLIRATGPAERLHRFPERLTGS